MENDDILTLVKETEDEIAYLLESLEVTVGVRIVGVEVVYPKPTVYDVDPRPRIKVNFQLR